ncbi:MAG: hypothetical protein BWZ08_01848 [candidate division BRC1 bacterium ADurb.BinA292]|nr:MAG: hypothetical protein BWZ08_01848 [candidate division BRC1 bacterium ADurb.BinA292]
MRKGFKLTLMVAIAFMGMRASAMVPVIGNIPDPIIGDSDGVTGTNEFVYPDALNLDNYASDPDGPSPLVWSYEGADDKYLFNGVDGLTGSDDPVNPGAKSINDQVLNGEQNPDNDAATVTIRNQDLSPIGGPNTDPGAAGIVDSETRVITLYASDGATVGTKEITVYTDNEGEDRLSTSEEQVASGNFNAGAEGWGFTTEYATGGTVTSSSNTGALCITVSAAGVNGAYWASPYDLIELTNESVYIGRFTLNTNQTTVGNTPLTIILVENSSQVDGEAVSLYFNDHFFLDNTGGANAPGGSHPVGSANKMILFTPPPVSTAEWQANAFNATNDPVNDARIRFRILDVDGALYGAESDSGQVCLDEFSISKVDINAFTRGTQVFSEDNLTAANSNATTLVDPGDPTFSNGDVTFLPSAGTRPTANNWDTEIGSLSPGDGQGDTLTGANLADDYPIPWNADDTLYELTVDLSAPNATSENQPVDVLRMGIDAPTQEYIGLAQITPSQNGIGMPNQGSPQTYRGFFAPNKVTLSNVTNHNRLRPRLDFICNKALGFNGQPGGTNPGGLTVHGWSVYEVTY